jgi:hypothetical protein
MTVADAGWRAPGRRVGARQPSGAKAEGAVFTLRGVQRSCHAPLLTMPEPWLCWPYKCPHRRLCNAAGPHGNSRQRRRPVRAGRCFLCTSGTWSPGPTRWSAGVKRATPQQATHANSLAFHVSNALLNQNQLQRSHNPTYQHRTAHTTPPRPAAWHGEQPALGDPRAGSGVRGYPWGQLQALRCVEILPIARARGRAYCQQ